MKIRELLSDETKWTKGEPARDKEGHRVFGDSKSAVRWCVLGAADKCYGIMKSSKVRKLMFEHLNARVDKWNDDPRRTFADVRKLVEELDI